ncbi:hypothetical protein [Magnetococcus sp. PR-3]|uniref:hypothetical protein n=1 Tax=Magnetococcus sp. PR-3 TaxID=3120355 RepID=UPI002FCE275D
MRQLTYFETPFNALQLLRDVVRSNHNNSSPVASIHVQLDPTSDDIYLYTNGMLLEKVVVGLTRLVRESVGNTSLIVIGCRDLGQKMMLWVESRQPAGSYPVDKTCDNPFTSEFGKDDNRLIEVKKTIEEDLHGALSFECDGESSFCFWMTLEKKNMKCLSEIISSTEGLSDRLFGRNCVA